MAVTEAEPAFRRMDLWGLYNSLAFDFRIFLITDSVQSIDSPREAELRSVFLLPKCQLVTSRSDSWLVQFEEQITKEWGPPEQRTKLIFLTDRGQSEDLVGLWPGLLHQFAARFSRASDPMQFYHVQASYPAILQTLSFFTRSHPLYDVLAWEVPWPSHICTGLFLGGAATVNKHALRELGITHLVCALEVPLDPSGWNANGEIAVLHCQVADVDTAHIDIYFEEVVKFIRNALSSPASQQRVLVHCAAGVSRSATLTAAYLLSEGFIDNPAPTTDETLIFLQSRRSCVRPNAGFVCRLREWENALRRT